MLAFELRACHPQVPLVRVTVAVNAPPKPGTDCVVGLIV
jgi:hypothetical protein